MQLENVALRMNWRYSGLKFYSHIYKENHPAPRTNEFKNRHKRLWLCFCFNFLHFLLTYVEEPVHVTATPSSLILKDKRDRERLGRERWIHLGKDDPENQRQEELCSSSLSLFSNMYITIINEQLSLNYLFCYTQATTRDSCCTIILVKKMWLSLPLVQTVLYYDCTLVKMWREVS